MRFPNKLKASNAKHIVNIVPNNKHFEALPLKLDFNKVKTSLYIRKSMGGIK